MRFVIVGAGRVGLRTGRALRESGHEVVFVEVDPKSADCAREASFEVIQGDGGLEPVLEKADLASADALGALTGDLNDNFVACLVADHHGCRTVLRIDEDYREEIYRKYADAVDEVIYPERLGAIAAKNALLGGNSVAIADIAQHLQLIQFTVTEQAPINGYSLNELELPANARLLAFGKHDDPVDVPDVDNSLEAGDRVVILADFTVLGDVRQLIVGEDTGQPAIGGV
ncbi:TrkA family potassium uptake protein [Halorhabdus sp. CBA1104]|uniref:potassium channel family protein n=1 Tax=Halorhabdus sp. CBA1104 TaxID=1380432 RepID=UPI0012B1EA15|nr:TrkA family potassium uptake protein [Halorhabdus sp. CBA1104]QGN08126.1 TrkA family potassium uptake protein [Halorhabdus sp. CBA1104]